MPKTAVGLFENPDLVDEVVRQIEALGFPRKEVRTLEQPTSFEVTGVMSFPRLDYQVTLIRELKRIGAAEAEAHSYLDGGRRGSGRIERAGRGAVQHWHSQGQRREYEAALKSDKFLLLAHGTAGEVAQARDILRTTHPMEVTVHAAGHEQFASV